MFLLLIMERGVIHMQSQKIQLKILLSCKY